MKNIERTFLTLAFAAAVSIVAQAPAFATIHTVQVSSYTFSPRNLQIQYGDTVRWVLQGGTHTTTSDPGSGKAWDSGILSLGTPFDVQFTEATGPGPFNYHCYYHGSYFNMTGSVAITASSVTVIDNANLPRGFAVEQNYPNPFNPSTVIKFSLEHSSNVEFSVFNVIGQTVEHKDLGELHPGSYSVVWNANEGSGKTFESGVYFYRVRAGDLIETRKMVLLK